MFSGGPNLGLVQGRNPSFLVNSDNVIGRICILICKSLGWMSATLCEDWPYLAPPLGPDLGDGRATVVRDALKLAKTRVGFRPREPESAKKIMVVWW